MKDSILPNPSLLFDTILGILPMLSLSLNIILAYDNAQGKPNCTDLVLATHGVHTFVIWHAMEHFLFLQIDI